MSVVSNALEEDATAEKGDLEGLDVDVGMVVAPCVGANAIRDNCSEQTVKVAEEEDCAFPVSTCDAQGVNALTEYYRRAVRSTGPN